MLRQDSFSCYGSSVFQTPNIDELAGKGTIFKNHYTAAPSSAMAYTCMFSGLWVHELNRKKYNKVEPFDQCLTLFQTLQNDGFSCNIIWDKTWFKTSFQYSRVYGDQTTKFHNLDIAQKVGPHKIDISNINPEDKESSLQEILNTVDSLITQEKLFIWLHLPHVIKGFTGYGSDIEFFDILIGKIRKRFNDNSIYITADHGQMNIEKGVPVYGFHVYEGAIKIPFITPRFNGLKEVETPTSNVQLMDILLNSNFNAKKYIYSDTQYYLQENRKLAIIKDNYKYIFNKFDKTEELYDIRFDCDENVNLLIDKYYDRNRFKYYNIDEIYYYPFWDKVQDIYIDLQKEKNRIWENGTWFERILNKLDYRVKTLIRKLIKRHTKIRIQSGRFNSKVKRNYYFK